MYTWGWGAGGCLGHGDMRYQLVPRLVTSLQGEDIVFASAGWKHTLVIKGLKNMRKEIKEEKRREEKEERERERERERDGAGTCDMRHQLISRLVTSLQGEDILFFLFVFICAFCNFHFSFYV